MNYPAEQEARAREEAAAQAIAQATREANERESGST
jgi:hypothetical protein